MAPHALHQALRRGPVILERQPHRLGRSHRARGVKQAEVAVGAHAGGKHLDIASGDDRPWSRLRDEPAALGVAGTRWERHHHRADPYARVQEGGEQGARRLDHGHPLAAGDPGGRQPRGPGAHHAVERAPGQPEGARPAAVDQSEPVGRASGTVGERVVRHRHEEIKED